MPTDLEALLTRVLASETWRWMEDYLVREREAAFAREAQNPWDMARKEGAIQTINRLLKAPRMLVQSLRASQMEPSDPQVFSRTVNSGDDRSFADEPEDL